MSKTNIFCVTRIGLDNYVNKHQNFQGTMDQAIYYAWKHNYKNGVNVIKDEFVYRKVKSTSLSLKKKLE